MTGPDMLTFSGVVTGGASWDSYVYGLGASVGFYGQWSNGLTGYGYADVVINLPALYNYADLSARVTPEPSSLGLSGGGILAIWGCRNRFWSKIKRS
jgi:PEP-CTERM motif-containing protein